MSTSRDFRINVAALQAAMEQQSESEEDETTRDGEQEVTCL